jgi:hypothetical protein
MPTHELLYHLKKLNIALQRLQRLEYGGFRLLG